MGVPEPAAVTGPVELQLHDGTVRGELTSLGVQRFLGVPFGAPPVGDLRWQPPQPVAQWTGVRPATEYSKSCPQDKNTFTDTSGISEDCLCVRPPLTHSTVQQLSWRTTVLAVPGLVAVIKTGQGLPEMRGSTPRCSVWRYARDATRGWMDR